MALTRAIGLMSGTSMDGIDLAVVETDGESLVRRGPSMFVPYESEFRRRIEASLEPARTISGRLQRPDGLDALERDLTLRHADAVSRFRSAHPDEAGGAGLIGFHGQTILHRPADALTVQLGDGPLLARETGVPVVYDMRANDVAHGGQGAPLVPVYHAALAASLPANLRRFPVCFVNIGGISNVTFVPETAEPVAFDSGPGNALIDRWVSREAGVPFDADGMIASEGGIVRAAVSRYLADPFFERAAPKSLDRNDFGLDHVAGLDLADGARTLAAVSAEAILQASAHMPATPRLWIVCGGGRRNPHIMRDLEVGASRSGADVILADDAGLDGDSMEAEAWAYLAVRSVRGLPLSFPTTTGCREPVSGGLVARP